MNDLILGLSSLTTLILGYYIMSDKQTTMYDKNCIEQCNNIPIMRCPYQACMGNCKRTNCVSRCSDQNQKPIANCENYCKDLKEISGNTCKYF